MSKLAEKYIASSNSYDKDLYLSCFTEDAKTFDEGEEETIQGKKAIGLWFDKTNKQYQIQSKILDVKEFSSDIIITANVSGSFKGSPINFKHHLKLKNNLIDDLRISVDD